jgi:hypothetical protein
MRPQFVVPVRRIVLAAGALAVASPLAASAVADTTGGAPAANVSGEPRARAAVVQVRKARLAVRAGRRALVQGVVRNAQGGQSVALQRRGGRGWHTVDRGRLRGNGAFRLRFTPRRASSAVLRVRFGDRKQGVATKRVGRLKVFRYALASWYGPGLYGNKLGCGGRLTPSTLGVAHKSLPCGTRLTVRHRGRSVRVRVIDRGPYVGDREFDLTRATKERIGFGSTGRIQVSIG